MTIGQGCCSLQGNTTELVYVAIQTILRQRTAAQIFHQLVITVFAFDVCLTVVVDPDNQLKAEVKDCLENLPVHIEVRIIDLQDKGLIIMFHQEHLSLSGIVAQDTHPTIVDSFQDKTLISDIFIHGDNTVSPGCSIISRQLRFNG